MSASTIHNKNYSPGLMSILPLFYVGWADGVLSPEESRKIKEKINTMDLLTKEDKDIALHWSTPTNPPTDEIYQNWQSIMSDYCSKHDVDQKSIIDLGIMLAKDCDACTDPQYWTNSETKAALLDLQSCMGVVNTEIEELLLDKDEVTLVADFDIKNMTQALDKKYTGYKAKIKKLLSYPEFRLQNLPVKEDYRAHTLQWTKALADQGFGALAFAPEYGGEDDMDENHELLPGVRVLDCGYKIGLNGVDNGRIWFSNVRVPRENLLNKFGDINEEGIYTSPIKNPSRRFFTMLGTLVGGRVCVPRAGLSAAKTGLNIAIKHCLKRRQFELKPGEQEMLLLDYPTHQRRLMPLLAKSYAISFGLDYLTDRFVNRSEKDIREIESLAAGMKSYATWFTTAALQEARESCGGKGYLSENRLGQLKADTEIFTTFEGDNTVLMLLVSKGLLSNFSKEFHDDGFVAVLRMLGNQFSTLVMEQNPFTKRKSESAYLLSGHFQMATFRYREQKLLYSVSQRMRGLIKQKMSSSDAFLRCQTHLLQLAEAFVERTILEQFIAQTKLVNDKPTRAALKQVGQLYALHTIESHKDFYLETEYMSPTKTKAIRRLVDKLCLQVRNQADALVEAFDIPDEILSAPIALK